MADSELALINKVDLRIALAENNSQFEGSLKLYLAPILLKLASPHQEVRKAIFRVIQNLIPRINAAREIQLPVENLLNQAKSPNVAANVDASSVVLYSLLFVSKGIDRLSDNERFRLIPITIKNISTFPSNVSSRLFNILGKLLQSWKVPDVESEEYIFFKKSMNLKEHPNDEKFLIDCISKFLLLRPISSDISSPLPGLSISDIEFFTKQAGVSYNEKSVLQDMKKRYLELLKIGFENVNLVVPLLIAATDSSSTIKDSSDILFKKLKFDIEDKTLIEGLFLLFNGSGNQPPVDMILQDRILNLLLKSKAACQYQGISEIISSGLTSSYPKLKQTTIQFIKWINIVDSKVETPTNTNFNREMYKKIKDNLLSEGWPKADLTVRTTKDVVQRQSQYEVLGNILRSTPSLFLNDFSPIQFLFNSLEGENADLRSTVQDALSGLTVHLAKLSIESKSQLKVLIKKYLDLDLKYDENNLHTCRYMSVKYSNSAFPFNDAEARYFCILGTIKGNKSETVEESLRGLHPYVFNLMQSSNRLDGTFKEYLGYESTSDFPEFTDMVIILDNELNKFNGYSSASVFKALGRAINFILETLVMQVIKGHKTVIAIDENWKVRLEKAIETDKYVQNLLIKGINDIVTTEDIGNSFYTFLNVVCDSYIGQYLDRPCIIPDLSYGSSLRLLLGFSPYSVVEKLTSKVDEFLSVINSRSLIDSQDACKAFGILASHPVVSDDSILKIFESLINNEAPKYSLQHRYLAISYLVSRLTLRRRNEVIPTEFLEKYLQLLIKGMRIEAFYPKILECIIQLSLYGTLGPVLNESLQQYKYDFIDGIKDKVKRCDELSVLTLGYLSLCFDSEKKDEINFEKLLYETNISKQIEFTFSSGEAFVIYACGWKSDFLTKQLDIQGETCIYIPQKLSKLLPTIELILKACSSSKPSLRKAGCLWLLSIVQYCGHLESVKNKSPEIHLAFMRFLADRDELVQESASRGLAIVYEMGDRELKDTLVHNLLKSFSDSTSVSSLTSGSVENDTQLFDSDVLRTHDGSISTYKDVLNLATDVGDPSLVYKFMSLSKSSMLWSSRKGMAFGLGSIMSKTSLSKLLESNKRLSDRLIPKLYRYKFDPNISVSQSMNEIWNSLVDDSSKTIKENFNIILEELLSGMGNKEWRVRQASTVALNEILSISSLEIYEYKMDEIWNMSFRVLDDIKESVRKEGSKLTKSLSSITVRSIENNSSKSNHILKQLIPFLIGNKGLTSDSEDVKDFSLKTILKLCDMKSNLLRSFAPSLVELFVSLMSNLEPDIVNYLILNADKYNLNNTDIDAKRLQGLGASPVMDAIEKLLDLLNNETMDEFASKIQTSIKRAVGLPSKVCGSRVLISMVTKRVHLIRPYGDKLLKLCISQLNDRNDAISSSYSIAAGYLCKIATIPTIIYYSKKIMELYFECEDDRNREIASVAVEHISKYSGEIFQSVSSAFLPLIYIGKHDVNDVARLACERVWIENTTGSSNSIKLFMSEIIEIYNTYLESHRFDIRQILARSIIDLCKALDDEILLRETNLKFLNILVVSCKRKSWSGKELLLEALVLFSIKCKDLVKFNTELLVLLYNTMLVEAKRRTKSYQRHSVKLLGKFISAFPDDDLIKNYIELIENVLSEKYDLDSDDDMEIDSKELTKEQNRTQELEKLSYLTNILESLGDCKGTYNSNLLSTLLKQINQYFESKYIVLSWISKIKLCEIISILIDKLNNTLIDEKDIEILLKNWQKLEEMCTTSENTESVYIAFIRVSGKLKHYLNECNFNEYAITIENSLKILKHVNLSVVQTEINKVIQIEN